jgi:hypothetical protein
MPEIIYGKISLDKGFKTIYHGSFFDLFPVAFFVFFTEITEPPSPHIRPVSFHEFIEIQFSPVHEETGKIDFLYLFPGFAVGVRIKRNLDCPFFLNFQFP